MPQAHFITTTQHVGAQGSTRRVGGGSAMSPVGTLLRAVSLWLCLCAGRAFVILRPSTVGSGISAPVGTRRPASAARNSHHSQALRASSVSARPRVPASSRWAMSASVYMSDEGEQYSTGGTGTGVQTIVKERIKEKVEEEVKEDLAKEQWWRVILHNDEIHTFDYVTQSITKVVKKLTMKKAYEVTMETHKAGKATVTQAWKSKAEGYCLKLQQCGLTASIAPDNKFEGGGDEEDGE